VSDPSDFPLYASDEVARLIFSTLSSFTCI